MTRWFCDGCRRELDSLRLSSVNAGDRDYYYLCGACKPVVVAACKAAVAQLRNEPAKRHGLIARLREWSLSW